MSAPLTPMSKICAASWSAIPITRATCKRFSGWAIASRTADHDQFRESIGRRTTMEAPRLGPARGSALVDGRGGGAACWSCALATDGSSFLLANRLVGRAALRLLGGGPDRRGGPVRHR